MQTKRRMILAFGVVMLILISWIFYIAMQPPVLPVGALMPHLAYIVLRGI